MAALAIIGTLLSTLGGGLATLLGALLKDTSVVLILLGASLGFHFGDEFGKWRQAKADAVQVRQGPREEPQPPHPRPIRDLIHFVVGAEPDEEDDQ